MVDVIIGGSGFVGSHIGEYLRARQRPHYILDLKLSPLQGEAFVEHDITLPLTAKTDALDTVYHLAAIGNPRLAQNELHATFMANVAGTFNVCEWARQNDAKGIVFMSSYATYGNQTKPCTEGDLPTPCNNYGFSKLEAECIVTNFCKNYGMFGVLVRASPIYGPRLRHALGADLVAKAKRLGKLEFAGNGEQSREYMHVNDLVSGIDTILANHPNGVQAYNIAGERLVSVKEIATLVSSKMGNLPVTFGGSAGDFPGDIKNTSLDCGKIRRLGWKPVRPFAEHYPAYLDEVIASP